MVKDWEKNFSEFLILGLCLCLSFPRNVCSIEFLCLTVSLPLLSLIYLGMAIELILLLDNSSVRFIIQGHKKYCISIFYCISIVFLFSHLYESSHFARISLCLYFSRSISTSLDYTQALVLIYWTLLMLSIYRQFGAKACFLFALLLLCYSDSQES